MPGAGHDSSGAWGFLQAGQCFKGTQQVSPKHGTEKWEVRVKIDQLDLAQGYVCGTMEAVNVPEASSNVITFWEGEIVDEKKRFFRTDRWQATPRTDNSHWSKFDAYSPSLVNRLGPIQSATHLFMRWKENHFVNAGTDCGLSINGFYYVVMERSTGKLDGYYYDPNSSPYQRLILAPTGVANTCGFSSGDFTLA